MASLSSKTLEERRRALDERFDELSLGGMWQSREPQVPLDPWVWHWNDIITGLREASELYRVPEDVKMRTVQLMSPALQAQKATSRTLQVSVQLLKDGERAPAHRHTPPQPRFIVEAQEGTYTVIDGEQLFMRSGDLVVTPSLSWHDHANLSQHDAVWLDIHDPHLVNYLGATLNEPFGEGAAQPVSKPEGYHRQRLGLFRTATLAGRQGAFPIKYSWSETLAALNDMAVADESTPYDGVILEYTNPLNGGPAMPTIGCHIQMLRPGETTLQHRHTDTTIYHVIQGAGTTAAGRADVTSLDWSERDCFIVPPWQWHRHENRSAKETAILFSVTDRPGIQALGYHREEASKQ